MPDQRRGKIATRQSKMPRRALTEGDVCDLLDGADSNAVIKIVSPDDQSILWGVDDISFVDSLGHWVIWPKP